MLDEAYLRDGQEVANRTKAKVYDGLYALDTLREIWDDIHNGKPPYPVEKLPEQLHKKPRFLRPDGTAIDGVYVFGDHVTGFVSKFYGPGGAGMTFAMVSGYLAGQQAAERKG